ARRIAHLPFTLDEGKTGIFAFGIGHFLPRFAAAFVLGNDDNLFDRSNLPDGTDCRAQNLPLRFPVAALLVGVSSLFPSLRETGPVLPEERPVVAPEPVAAKTCRSEKEDRGQNHRDEA